MCGDDVEMNPGSDWYNVRRNICADDLLNNRVTFSGQGHMCAIDEVSGGKKEADTHWRKFLSGVIYRKKI